MALDPISLREYREPDRAAVQIAAVEAVSKNPEAFIARYEADPRSYGGRYISADLFKETFDAYSQSLASRDRYNSPLHNTAAVLSAEQFKRAINASEPGQTAIFLTGIPGAGKTSSITSTGSLPERVAVVFEGQLSRPDSGMQKIQAALDAGLRPVVMAVHVKSEQALEGTIQRYNTEGRGASLNVMSEIQGGLPDGLLQIRERFGEQVQLLVKDNRDRMNPVTHEGWKNIDLLKSEGKREQIHERLQTHLDHLYDRGRLSDAAYRQAAGLQPPAQRHERMAAAHGRSDGANDQGRSVPQASGSIPFITIGEPREDVARAFLDNKPLPSPLLDAARNTHFQLDQIAKAAGPRSAWAAAQVDQSIKNSIAAHLMQGGQLTVSESSVDHLRTVVAVANIRDAARDLVVHPERTIKLRAEDRDRGVVEAQRMVAQASPKAQEAAQELARALGALEGRAGQNPFQNASLGEQYDRARTPVPTHVRGLEMSR